MNIRDFLANLFKPKTNKDIDLINIGSLLKIPEREDFLGNLEMLNLLAKLKKEYIQIICQNKYITSLDLDQDISNKLNRSIGILTNNILNEDEELKQLTIKDKVEYLIKARKLKLYREEIKDLEKEVIARIIVLKEIYQTRRYFLLKNKKEAIINEINNLSKVLATYMANKVAINLEILSYIKKAIYLTKDIDKTKEEKIIKSKVIQLKEMINLVFKDYDYKESYNLIDIASMEKDLEEWSYDHKDITDLLNKYNEDYFDVVYWDYYNKINKKTLKRLKNIELLFLIYYKYGYKKELINILKSLYKLKFACLIKYDAINEAMDLENMEDIEKETYKEIVAKKIEYLVMGLNDSFNTLFNIDVAQAKDAILNILKEEKNYYDYEEILTNKYLLNFLIACDTTEGLDNLFKKYMVKKEDYEYLDFYEDAFSWNEDVSLGAIAWLAYYQGKDNESILYNLVNKHYKKDNYYLPEGLREIDNTESSYTSNCYKILRTKLELFYEDMNGKNLIMPSSLRRICDIILKNIKLNSLSLNKGLEVMSFMSLDNQNLETIMIPASLKITQKIGPPLVNVQAKRIFFDDYQDSNILNDINNLMCFLSLFVEVKDCEQISLDKYVFRYYKKDDQVREYKYITDNFEKMGYQDFLVVIDSKGYRIIKKSLDYYKLWDGYKRYDVSVIPLLRKFTIYADYDYCLEKMYNYSLNAFELVFLQNRKHCFIINTTMLKNSYYLNVNNPKIDAARFLALGLRKLIKLKEEENNIKLVRKNIDNK